MSSNQKLSFWNLRVRNCDVRNRVIAVIYYSEFQAFGVLNSANFNISESGGTTGWSHGETGGAFRRGTDGSGIHTADFNIR